MRSAGAPSPEFVSVAQPWVLLLIASSARAQCQRHRRVNQTVEAALKMPLFSLAGKNSEASRANLFLQCYIKVLCIILYLLNVIYIETTICSYGKNGGTTEMVEPDLMCSELDSPCSFRALMTLL